MENVIFYRKSENNRWHWDLQKNKYLSGSELKLQVKYLRRSDLKSDWTLVSMLKYQGNISLINLAWSVWPILWTVFHNCQTVGRMTLPQPKNISRSLR